MKSIMSHSHRCMVCGNELVKSMTNDDSFICEQCGEEYDLELLSKMELEFDEFEKLLLLDIKTRNKKVNRIANLIY
jgi:hypothetical protein